MDSTRGNPTDLDVPDPLADGGERSGRRFAVVVAFLAGIGAALIFHPTTRRGSDELAARVPRRIAAVERVAVAEAGTSPAEFSDEEAPPLVEAPEPPMTREAQALCGRLLFGEGGAAARADVRRAAQPRTERALARIASAASPKSDAVAVPEVARSEERTAVAAPVAEPASPPATATASVTVVSSPPGADVLLNGVSRGRTPLDVSDVEPGSYALVLRHDGYRQYARAVSIADRSHVKLEVALAPASGALRLVSEPPGADIQVNHTGRGQTPLVVNGLETGVYEVQGTMPGYPPQTLRVRVGAEQTTDVRFSFAQPQTLARE